MIELGIGGRETEEGVVQCSYTLLVRGISIRLGWVSNILGVHQLLFFPSAGREKE